MLTLFDGCRTHGLHGREGQKQGEAPRSHDEFGRHLSLRTCEGTARSDT